MSASTSTTVPESVKLEGTGYMKQKVSELFQYYEDVIGLTDVREAQRRVLKAEEKFMETQELRRDRQSEIQHLQSQLKEIHVELDKTSRGEDRYLKLITQEHSLIRNEKSLIDEFKLLERAERDYFSTLSLAVRESHEKERAQSERTKYWSIIGSVCGAVIGIVGSSINNRLRMRELRGIVEQNVGQGKIQELVSDLTQAIQSQHSQMSKFVTDLKTVLQGNMSPENLLKSPSALPVLKADVPLEKLETRTNEILSIVQKQEKSLTTEMKEIRGLVTAQAVLLHGGDEEAPLRTIYMGEDMEKIVQDAQKNLEKKMKIHSLATVALVYGALAITLPILMQIFKGS